MTGRLFGPSIPRRELNALRLLSLVDFVLLVALVYAALTGRHDAVGYLGPAHGILFLLLLAGLALAARKRWWGWRFVGAVVVLGPLASIPGLEHHARAARRALR